MSFALKEAKKAAQEDEVPVGAVVVREGKVIARAHNRRENAADPTAHAELLAIRRAAKKLGGWRLMGCTLYVTLEPCPMCAGAILNARLPRVCFGAYDPKAGAFGTLMDLNQTGLNHRTEVQGGILEEECAQVLKDYFRQKRARQKGGQESLFENKTD